MKKTRESYWSDQAGPFTPRAGPAWPARDLTSRSYLSRERGACLLRSGYRQGVFGREPSGGYERAFVQALARARMQVSLVQANRVSAAAILAKTDRIDAQVLCAFGAAMRPPTITASNLEQEHLRELESQRRHLTHLLVMEQNRLRE